jgi:hypothetical protein
MRSTYEQITQYDGTEFEEYLRKLNLLRLFTDLHTMFKNTGHFESIVKYIVHCYSFESEFVARGATWAQIKHNVAKYVMLPESLNTVVVELGIHTQFEAEPKDDQKKEEKRKFELQVSSVTQAIHDYMSFENDRDNRHLKKLYDLYEEQQAGMSDSSISYDEKDKCRKRAKETREEIEQIEQGIKNKITNPLKEGLREMDKVPTSLRPEIAARKW